MALPKIISVDDHVVEPPDLWTSRLPRSLRDRVPHVRREFGGFAAGKYDPNKLDWSAGADVPNAGWADVWYYDDMVVPLTRGLADCGYTTEDPSRPVTYDEVLPGCYQRDARLADMAANHTDVSLCFPTVPRFCGQIFMERQDKKVGLDCVRAFNDWMIEDWCGDTSRAERLIPLTLIPLWDPALAAEEVRRCAEKGSHAIAFSECPPYLGLPSIYSGAWDPLFQACQDTDTVINMHIGSSSKLVVTAPDAPVDTIMCLSYVNALLAVTDWLYTGTLERFPELRIALSESQAGWVPFAVQRADTTWTKANEKFHLKTDARKAKNGPSEVIPGRVFFCIFDDLEGLQNRDKIGFEQLLFETDYPHTDSTWPDSVAYSAAKGGLGPLTHIMAREFAPFDIRVNVIATGQTNQVSAEVLDGGTYQDSAASMAATAASPAGPSRFPGNWYMEQLAQATPLKRSGPPQEWAGMLAFLASSDASYVTGQVMVVDCGRTGLTPGTFPWLSPSTV